MRTPVLALALAGALALMPAFARDLGQWGNQTKEIRAWFARQMQPDMPSVSCCGEADAYWADTYSVEGDHYVAIITDERPDAPLMRPHIDPGTRIAVPNEKMKFGAGDPNPTGHGIIFLSISNHIVYCYLPPSQM